MPKFRKKPVVVKALQFDGTRESAGEIFKRLPSGSLVRFITERMDGTPPGLHIRFGSSEVWFNKDDWCIIDGDDISVCKPDIFAATYEPVEG